MINSCLLDCFSLHHSLLVSGKFLLAKCDVLRYLVDIRVSCQNISYILSAIKLFLKNKSCNISRTKYLDLDLEDDHSGKLTFTYV